MKEFDVLIAGAGPGGLTAGIYLGRALLKVGIIDRMMPGGQIGTTDWVDNYPGFEDGISGLDLAGKMEKQAKRFGAEFLMANIDSMEIEGTVKKLKAGEDVYTAKAVMINTGTDPQLLGIPGEKEFKGRGVSYCGTCDAPFFKDKKVIVVGGGSTSMQESLHIAKFARSVTLISRRPRIEELKAEKILVKKVLDHPSIHLELHKRLKEIKGNQKITGAAVEHIGSGKIEQVDADGIFIFIGWNPNTQFLKGKLDLDETGFVLTNEKMETSLKGVFAIGDVRKKDVRQIVTAVGDGAVGAQSVIHYIEGLENDGTV
jgi:thioredoxin reductase (NADPH)